MSLGGEQKAKIDSKKIGFNEDENILEKILNVKGIIKNNNENNRIEDNTKNKGTNRIIENIRNNNHIIIQRNITRKKTFFGTHLYLIEHTIVFITFFHIFLRNKASPSGSRVANITLKINGIGTKKLFGHEPPGQTTFESQYYPDEVYINEQKEVQVNYEYYFNDQENFVELIWDHYITNTVAMFYGYSF